MKAQYIISVIALALAGTVNTSPIDTVHNPPPGTTVGDALRACGGGVFQLNCCAAADYSQAAYAAISLTRDLPHYSKKAPNFSYAWSWV